MKIKHLFGLAVIAAMTASCQAMRTWEPQVQVLVLMKQVLVMQLSPSTCLR